MRCAKLQSLIQSYIIRLEYNESARYQRTAIYESDQSINVLNARRTEMYYMKVVNQPINQSVNESVGQRCLMIGVQHREGESVDSLLVLI